MSAAGGGDAGAVPPTGLAALLGFEVLPSPEGSARVRATVSEQHLNLHGSAHGGFLYSLADEAFAIASNSREADALALSVRIDYFKAVRPGDRLEAVASEEHLGRSVATYRVEVLRSEGPYAEGAATVAEAPASGEEGRGVAARDAAAQNAAARNAAAPDTEERDAAQTRRVALFTGTAFRRPRPT